MDVFLALLAASAAKIYDDCVDNNMITNEYHKKMLETLQCYLLGAISINNFTFSIVMFIIITCNYLGGREAFSNPYEFSLLAMYPIFIILSYSKREYLNVFDLGLFLFLGVFGAIEPMLIKEDSSPRKLIIRCLYPVLFMLCMICCYKLLSNGIFLILLYTLGYVTVSIGFQIYACSHMSIDEFSKQLFEGMQELLSDVLSACGFNQKSKPEQLPKSKDV